MAHILAADDDPATLTVIVRVLHGAGHQVTTAADGETAIRRIRRLRPDLVLTDVDMPFINGFLLCDEIRQDPDLRNTPVILVTGVINPSDHRAAQVGATAVLVKPFSADQLLTQVDSHLLALPA